MAHRHNVGLERQQHGFCLCESVVQRSGSNNDNNNTGFLRDFFAFFLSRNI
ncbi:hypothetical protein [Lysinibacillus sp. fls2-241-R2A-57]|uniref:hypothetical protein n=1 Tax=Lysinibacillus sp. fls2-241-R2A-57 TaxID=3040292 RepID=UPI002556ED74|nr:hypothetical protein [Lysinibacillus sp. fls2-241-R2A-57]